MAHALFIAAAYGIAALGLIVLTLYLIADNRAQRRALAELEARGVRRRSEGRGA
ncbi:heme exporter protein CcmD [Aquabacter spiritensis]|uniref:Heme exporter protein D n=1 Tax=Aquabacter spiritensis TaxID=933073 RepID=A0A4R3LWM9_9HYPH|nr:heme exporter protein CcmD [Aquabacter spiritensis]TCT05024.1 heme exporter protein D [Aquabacter spiritensis]